MFRYSIKSIYKYLKTHYEDDFHLGFYLYVLFFVFVCLFLNYEFKVYKNIQAIQSSEVTDLARILKFMVFYSVSWFGVALPAIVIKRKWNVLKSTEFWIKAVVIITLLSLGSGWFGYRAWFQEMTRAEIYWSTRCLSQFKRFLICIVPIILIYFVYDKGKVGGLYGMRKKGFDWRIYWPLLLLMVPLIVWASYQPSFIKAYPRFRPWLIPEVFGLSKPLMTTIFEFCYGLDFIAVEWVFRGLIVLTFVKFLGPTSVLPMVVTYAFIHFGKPSAEAIGSIFGGYILGVIAYYSKNIWGGVVVHLGVGWMMEIAAFLQRWSNSG